MNPFTLYFGAGVMVFLGVISGETTEVWVGLGLMWMGLAAHSGRK